MSLYIIKNNLDIIMHLHIQTIIIDDELIHIRNHLLHLRHIQKQSVGGHEDKSLRQLLPGIFVEFHDTLVQPWLMGVLGWNARKYLPRLSSESYLKLQFVSS